MPTLIRLYYEFFKTGLFAIGGGFATIPFLKDMGRRTGWFSPAELMNMIAISESTPGPIGINMATYAGYTAAGVPGAVLATLGEITPSIVVVLIVAAFLKRFKESAPVRKVFYGIRPASAGLITAAILSVIVSCLTAVSESSAPGSLLKEYAIGGSPVVSLPKLLTAVGLFVVMNRIPRLGKLHPLWIILFGAAAGILFRFSTL